MNSPLSKKILVLVVLSACLIVISVAFWQQEMQYSLPTPVPVNYVTIRAGESVSLPRDIEKGNAYFFSFLQFRLSMLAIQRKAYSFPYRKLL